MVTWTATLLSLRAWPVTWQQHSPAFPCDGRSPRLVTGTAPSDGPTGESSHAVIPRAPRPTNADAPISRDNSRIIVRLTETPRSLAQGHAARNRAGRTTAARHIPVVRTHREPLRPPTPGTNGPRGPSEHGP